MSFTGGILCRYNVWEESLSGSMLYLTETGSGGLISVFSAALISIDTNSVARVTKCVKFTFLGTTK